MGVISLLGSMTATGIVSIAAARYLSKRLLDHRLSKDMRDYDEKIDQRLASYKAELDGRLNEAKAEREATLRREVEEYLGERSSERDYRAEAKKRLYLAVGPLRFQLLVAAELVNRVARIGGDKYTYDMSIKGYFGQSTIYRLLRVLAISELIEGQIAYADFAVDPAMRSLLKFKRQAFQSLSSYKVSLGHPAEDWNNQKQHVFHDVLGIIASALIVHDAPNASSRVMRFDEFAAKVTDVCGVRDLDPIPHLAAGFSIQSKPILWLRLLAIAQLCVGLLETHGSELGLEIERIDIKEMLDMTEDVHIRSNLNSYIDAIDSFRCALTDSN